MTARLNCFDELRKKWSSTIVARSAIGRFTGGLYSPKYMANQDSLGEGVPGRFRCGRQIVYPVDSLLKWLEDRVEAC